MNPAAKPRAWACACVALLTLVALVERAVGIGHRLPHQRDPDTAIVHQAAWHDRPAGVAEHDAAYASTIYPFLLSGILIALPGSNYARPASADAPLEAHLAAASAPYLRARWLVSLLSLLIVPATYLLARRWLERTWSVLAAALAATSLLHLVMSQQARPHAATAAFCAWGILGALWIFRSSSWRAYLGGGAVCGLALASLHSGLFVLPSLGLAPLLGWKRDRRRERWLRCACAFGLCAVAFVLAYPFLVFGDPLQSSGTDTFNFGQHAIRWETWNGGGFAQILPELWSYEPVLVALAVVGLLSAIRSSSAPASRAGAAAEFWIVAMHVLVTILAFGMQQQFYVRFLLPIFPAACVLGAAGARWIAARAAGVMHGAHTTAWVNATIAALALALPAYASARLALVRARDDTERIAARWIAEHARAESETIALDFTLCLPLAETRAGLLEIPGWRDSPWQRYQLGEMPREIALPRFALRPIYRAGFLEDQRIDASEARQRLAELDPTWVVVSASPQDDGGRNETWAALRDHEPAVVISPFIDSGADSGIDSGPRSDLRQRAVGAGPLRTLLGIERLGPVIEIHRLK